MRERISLDQNWRFALGHAANAALDFEYARDRSLVKAGEARGAAGYKFEDGKWKQVNVPHDWAIELPFVKSEDREAAEHGFRKMGPDHPETSVGWYRRTFKIPKGDLGRRISIAFDGVFRDSIVWVNGFRMGRHPDGTTPFRYDITDVVKYGEDNVIAVRCDITHYEGWWYEGGGIYRHVWLVKTDPLHIAPDGVCVRTELAGKRATVNIVTKISNESDDAKEIELISEITDSAGKAVAAVKPVKLAIAPWTEIETEQSATINNPALWSPEQPNLYRVKQSLKSGKTETDAVETIFGVRTFKFDAKRGFLLNGQPYKIQGTCNHHQHAGVGTAMPDRLHEFRVEKLKELGSNAYRCSHYCATPELLDICDRLGMLVLAENRLAGSSEEVLGQFATMIVRDRNHASIFGWSLANEEHTVQWAIAGERIGKTMVRLAHRLDPTRIVTTAMHDRGLGAGFANVVDVHGWNYLKVGDLEAFHKRRPDQPILGSEEASTVCTRGIYTDDPSRGYVAAYDRRSPGWGGTAEKTWTFYDRREWLAGSFIWTGFDYYGEPIPYKWPCTASHFGLMDLCGFPKDLYYFYHSWWQNKPVLHLLPHWNWTGKEGQEIDVRCFSNCEEIELLHNGKSLGRKPMVRTSHVAWNVLYEPGVLEAHGYTGGKAIAHARVETTDVPAKLAIAVDRPTLKADGEDVAWVQISALDAKDRLHPTACDLLHFEITGPGKIIGVGNGDPSSHELDHAMYRKLFNGLAMVLIQSERKPGKITLTVQAEGLGEAKLNIETKRAKLRPSLP